MKEMWTGIYPKKKEYKYEVRFRTDDRAAFDHVVKACRNMIDGKPIDIKLEKMFQGNVAFGHSEPTDFWLKVQCDDNPQQMFKVTKENPVVELKCRCGKEYAIDTADLNWSPKLKMECRCGRSIYYEKI